MKEPGRQVCKKTDVQQDYIELKDAVLAMYIRLENIYMAAGESANAGMRVVGLAKGSRPNAVKQFLVLGWQVKTCEAHG